MNARCCLRNVFSALLDARGGGGKVNLRFRVDGDGNLERQLPVSLFPVAADFPVGRLVAAVDPIERVGKEGFDLELLEAGGGCPNAA